MAVHACIPTCFLPPPRSHACHLLPYPQALACLGGALEEAVEITRSFLFNDTSQALQYSRRLRAVSCLQ